MAESLRVFKLNQRELRIIGDGGWIKILVVGWWRPRLQVTTCRDDEVALEHEEADGQARPT